MIGFGRRIFCGIDGARAVLALVLLAGLAGCSVGGWFGAQPQATAAAAPVAESPAPAEPEPEPVPPPVDLGGRWQLAAAAGGSCYMNFTDAPGGPAAVAGNGPPDSGAIAPEAGCPGRFFTSRKWSFESGMLIIRDFKGRQLAQLSYLGGHFEGQDKNGSALTLSKPL